MMSHGRVVQHHSLMAHDGSMMALWQHDGHHWWHSHSFLYILDCFGIVNRNKSSAIKSIKVYLGYRIAKFKTNRTSCVGRVRISIKYKQQCEDWEQRVFRPCRNPLLGCGKIHSESERERCWDTRRYSLDLDSLACTASYTLHSAVSFWRYSLDLDSLTQLHRTHCLYSILWSLFGTIHTLLHNLRFTLWCLLSFWYTLVVNFEALVHCNAL